jgi:hypothetical protein
MPRQTGVSFDDAKTNTRTERVRVTDLITLFKWPEKKWVTVRFYPELHSYATGWVKTITKDKKEIKFPVPLRSYDPSTMEFDSTIYDPWNDLFLSEKDVDQKSRTIQVSRKFYGNMIVRKLQANLPEKLPKPTPEEKESGFKDKDSDTLTCWSAFALPPGAIRKIQELKGINTVESKKTGKTREYSVTDQTFGCDIKVYYDPDKSPAEQYTFQIGERTPLTDEELAMLRWDTASLEPNMPDEKTVRADYEQWAARNGRKVSSARKAASEEDDEDGFEEEPKRGGKRRSSEDDEDEKPARSGKRRAAEPEEEDDDLEETPKRSSGKRRVEPEDDDDIETPPKRNNKRRTDPVDEDDTEEEETPKRGGKRKVEEDDDDGFDEPPKRGGKRNTADDEDELDEPPKRSGKRRAEPEDDDGFEDEKPKRSTGGKKKPVEDDDDLADDDAFDEDDDEPEEKPKRRR